MGEKLERDATAIFNFLESYHSRMSEQHCLDTGEPRSAYRGIQAWCADMWAFFYNALLARTEIRIHPELDFCWPHDHICAWHQKKILHYSGASRSDREKYFSKSDFIHHQPFYHDFRQIDPQSCSHPVVSMIAAYGEDAGRMRKNLRDVTFLIPVHIDSEERLGNLKAVIRYLQRNFNAGIIVAEADSEPKLSAAEFTGNCRYYFCEDKAELFHHAKLNNFMIRQAETDIIAICDTDVVLPPLQYLAACWLIRSGEAALVSPYSGEVYSVDSLQSAIFRKMLDTGFLTFHLKKHALACRRSLGGITFIRKSAYVAAGMDNEFFTSWGPEDIERVKRMDILGYRTSRVDGPLFHLHHPRLRNSGYAGAERRAAFMEEYLNICSMSPDELERYISTWPWLENITLNAVS